MGTKTLRPVSDNPTYTITQREFQMLAQAEEALRAGRLTSRGATPWPL